MHLNPSKPTQLQDRIFFGKDCFCNVSMWFCAHKLLMHVSGDNSERQKKKKKEIRFANNQSHKDTFLTVYLRPKHILLKKG